MGDYAPVDLTAADQVEFELNGRRVTAPAGTMLVDAAYAHGVEVPIFCYEPRLGAAIGACRMCLVEVEGMRGLQTACSTAVQPDMVVSTTSEAARDGHDGVLEFLLENHPLDCPVCDKGGECPLQDRTFKFGPPADAHRRDQAPLPQAARPLVADRARPRALHLVLPLRALQPGGGRGRRADHGGPRRRQRDRHLHRRRLRGPLHRQRHRPLPGGRAHEHPLPLRRPALGHPQRAVGVRPLPGGLQRRAHRARGPGEPGDRPARPQLRGRGGLALRQGPLRVPGRLGARPAAVRR